MHTHIICTVQLTWYIPPGTTEMVFNSKLYVKPGTVPFIRHENNHRTKYPSDVRRNWHFILFFALAPLSRAHNHSLAEPWPVSHELGGSRSALFRGLVRYHTCLISITTACAESRRKTSALSHAFGANIYS